MKKYKILYQENFKIKKLIIKSDDIKKEILPDNIIEIKKIFDFTFSFEKKIKDSEIKNKLYELSLMINSKILLEDAFTILIKNEKRELIKDFLNSLKGSFSNSLDFEKSMKKFHINPLIKSIFKIVKDSGNPASNIKSMSEIINENLQIKKEFKKVMTYPLILLCTFFMALIGIFNFVVPNFESMFKSGNMKLPTATKILLSSKEIFENYSFHILLFLVLIVIIFVVFYKSHQKFRYFLDFILLKKAFIISEMYRLKTFYIYFVILEILMKSKYDFPYAFSKAKILINNQYLFDKITQIENLLKSGKSISYAFESSELFDDVTLNLINSGEVSNSLESAVCEIKNIFKKRFDDSLKLFSLLIEPLFFIIIMALIVWIILAVFVPLWSMSDMLKS